jgi:hypothetical protein
MKTMKSKLDQLRHFSLTKLLLFFIFIALIPLVVSIIKSGYLYVLDNDELNHVQLTYLYAHGSRPYLDIYNSVYTPLFGWFLLPIFGAMDFSFETIAFTRYIMIILFAIRVIASYVLVHKIFGRRIAYLFLPMFLTDPFVIFSSMQIRPDNLMMTLYSVGFLLFSLGMYGSKKLLFVAGVLLSTSLLVLPKILPAVGVILLGSIAYCLLRKKHIAFTTTFLGLISPFILFVFYGIVSGSLAEIGMQAIVEAKAAYSYFSIGIPLGNFYIPGNFFVYGSSGKPLTWFYAWLLPHAAAAGIFITVMEYVRKRSVDAIGILKLMLVATLLLQWGVLFFLQVVFMQHYLPISWLYVLFTAVAIEHVLVTVSTYRHGLTTSHIVLTVLGLALIITSIKTNIGRSKVDSKELIATMKKRWEQIPEGTYTFPNYLFRPSMFPITYGYFIGNVPPVILNRLPSIIKRIEQHNVQYLLVDDYLMGKLPEDVRIYIQNRYTRVPGDGELMTPKP